MENFKVIIVEDVPLELKGTLGIVRSDIPEAEVIGTADTEPASGVCSSSRFPTSYSSTSASAARRPSAWRSVVTPRSSIHR